MDRWQYTLLTERYLDMLERHYIGSAGTIVDEYFRDHLHLDNDEQMIIFHQGEDYIK